MVTAPVDKTTHNIAHCCKVWYQHKLQEALRQATYTPSDEDSNTVLHRHEAHNLEHGLRHVPNHHYLYLSIKLHKDPIGVRTIAGTSKRKQNTHEQPIGSEPPTKKPPNQPQQLKSGWQKYSMQQLKSYDTKTTNLHPNRMSQVMVHRHR